MNFRYMIKLMISILTLLTIISCASININGSIKKYRIPEGGIVLSILSEQSEIRIRNPDGSYTIATPPVIALYNAYLSNQRSKALYPVLSDLNGFDFFPQMSEKINESLSNIEWLKINENYSSRKLIHNILPIGTHRLLFDIKYEFTPNMDSIEVTVFVTFKKVTKVKKNLTKKVRKYSSIYENRYKYISPLADPIGIIRNKKSAKNNALKIILGEDKKTYSPNDKLKLMSKYWSFNNSIKVKEYLTEAINKAKAMILHDLSFKKKLTDSEYYDSLKNFNQFYEEIDRSNERLFLESNSWFKKGSLCSIPLGAETYRCTDNINY